MNITIEQKGLETILNTLLSCKCPVEEQVELAVFKAYHQVKNRELIDYGIFLEIADRNPQRTPLHLLADFCSHSKDNLKAFTITHNDTIRYSCTGYHFNNFKDSINPLVVRDNASFLVGHMIVPARLKGDDGMINGYTRKDNHTIVFNNLLVPPEMSFNENTVYGIHLATAVTELTEAQEEMVVQHLDNITGFDDLLKSVDEVNYCDFQYFGNYREQVQIRIDRNFD